MRLIDADALKAVLTETKAESGSIGEVIVTIFCGVIDEQPEAVVRCKDCKYFDLDYFQNIQNIEGFPIPLVVAHEIYTKWSDGCKTSPNGWCFIGERRTDE